MLRTSLSKNVGLRPLSAAFSTSAPTMALGDTGAPPKTGGQGDAFQRRERASEDMAIRRREMEKIASVRKSIEDQRRHLDSLAKHIDELAKDREEQDKKK